ncbi:protein of unknown function [Pseudorhizobium banfieldiae]|uniref:Uncharacterized protein n=1 Tax=Pseudorhizobium banfieldiae TaxID=1125847 RepID=L0NDE9_9HYPH|nr:hypothetical protein [Pseudorhizobium banfieldiae]CAD6605896.1 hypothetical protein RNT25_01744 [arsenite-oxidising bacterium NT-25]CCF19090.1 protein of unknown function [Pseudorhizobium banfieldiae]
MSTTYKTITRELGDENQYYVAEDRVTEEQIKAGDDDGVVCLCLSPDAADTIARLLTNYSRAGGTI